MPRAQQEYWLVEEQINDEGSGDGNGSSNRIRRIPKPSNTRTRDLMADPRFAKPITTFPKDSLVREANERVNSTKPGRLVCFLIIFFPFVTCGRTVGGPEHRKTCAD